MSGSVTMSSMKNLSGERGSVNSLLLPVIILAILFVGAASFGTWAFMSRQDYKNNSDAKSAVAVAANTKKVQAADAVQYAEAAKSPVKTFMGPEAYGDVRISYPKTWSAYAETETSSSPLNAYFHSDYVPAEQKGQTYRLRVEIVTAAYSRELSSFNSAIAKGTVTAAAYSLPKVPSVVGTRLSGAIFPGAKTAPGVMILMPLRDKTLKIWTESNDYLKDFDTYVLPEVTFSP